MNELEVVTGYQASWKLVQKLGEGDAGEVFQVESVSNGRAAILKRPQLSAFIGEMFRQSGQIQAEARILKALSGARGFNARLRVSVPNLLDQNRSGADYNNRNFIVIERASGVDLSLLARTAQMGQPAYEPIANTLGLEDRVMLDAIARSGKIPARILLHILYRLIHFMEYIHSLSGKDEGVEISGILWNDVKPDHLFWDSLRSQLTIIDWGNARFLEEGQVTRDRKFSWADDNRQYIEEMGRFLNSVDPELRAQLEWPGLYSAEALEELKRRLEKMLELEAQNIAEIRASEETLLQLSADGEMSLPDIEAIHQQVLAFGETPDFNRTLRYTETIAARLAQQDRLADLGKLCPWAASLPGANADQWNLIQLLARLPGQSTGHTRQLFIDAIQNAIGREWDDVLWNITLAIADYPEPDWWPDLTSAVRRLALGPEESVLRPLIAVKRVMFTLQAAVQRLERQAAAPADPFTAALSPLEKIQQVIRLIKEDVLPNWTQPEPSPPDCNLEYKAVRGVLAEAGELLGESGRGVQGILDLPAGQAALVLEHWGFRNFLSAGRELRRLLVWDPDRKRLLRADRAILSAPDYLSKIQLGPQSTQEFPEWITNIEFRGRELRNQVGPAGWLDTILEACKQIRKGVWPSDLALANPEILREMPWLVRFERRERMQPLLSAEPGGSSGAGSAGEGVEPPPPLPVTAIVGIRESRVGPDENVSLTGPLDSWMPEARGSSARVVGGLLRFSGGAQLEAAIKLMRMDQVSYALPLFREEARILSILRDVPGVAHLLECGFIRLEEGQFPLVSADAAPPAAGEIVRIGPDSTPDFIKQIDERIADAWTPYLAIEPQEQPNNLLYLCDAGMTRGMYQPIITLLQISIQICDILEIAHQRNIVYRDHKLLHYYWHPAQNGVYLIDWNVSRYHPEGLSQTEIEMDIVQFGARGLHHILTGRTAPGALPLGPTRPEEIEHAAHTYQTQWTYDDLRLSGSLRAVLERILAGGYTQIATLRDDLKKTMMHIPDSRPLLA